MAGGGDPLVQRVTVDVKPSATAVAVLDKTQAKIKAIETQARAATAAVASAESAVAAPQGGRFVAAPRMVGFPVRQRRLGEIAAVRDSIAAESAGIKFGQGGIKLGRFGSLGAGGFVLGSGAVLRSVMPLMVAAGATRAAAGLMDGLASSIETYKREGLRAVGEKALRNSTSSVVGMIGVDQVATALARLDRAGGGSLMTREEAEKEEARRKEIREKANEEAQRFGNVVHSQLVSQSAAASQSWAGKPDAYRLNRRLADTIDATTRRATELRRAAAEVQLFNAGTDY